MKGKLKGKESEVIAYYLDNHSQAETARHFSVNVRSISELLVKCSIERRSLSEAMQLCCKQEEWKTQHSEKLQGKPSGALNKHWKFERPIRKPNLYGEKNPAWRGGILSLSRAIRDTPEYRLWREWVFTRDNYTCLHCGARSCEGNKIILNADHITPFVTLIRQYHIASIEEAIQCMALWDIENGRTLCEPCHKQTESYGLNLIYHLEKKEEASS